MEHVEVKYITNSDITQRQKIEVCSRDISEIFKENGEFLLPTPLQKECKVIVESLETLERQKIRIKVASNPITQRQPLLLY